MGLPHEAVGLNCFSEQLDPESNCFMRLEFFRTPIATCDFSGGCEDALSHPHPFLDPHMVFSE